MLTWGGACVRHVVRINYDAVVPMVCLPSAAGDTLNSNRSRDSVPHANNTPSSGPDSTLVTPWHPVCIEGQWTFPCRVAAASPVYMACVYNLVLDTHHVRLQLRNRFAVSLLTRHARFSSSTTNSSSRWVTASTATLCCPTLSSERAPL